MENRNKSAIEEQIGFLEGLNQELKRAKGMQSRLEILAAIPAVKAFVEGVYYKKIFKQIKDPFNAYLIQALAAIGQGNVVFEDAETLENHDERLEALLQILRDVERSYGDLGGIVGYHLTVLKLLLGRSSCLDNGVEYLEPEGFDNEEGEAEVNTWVKWGIEGLADFAEIYPIGGAGDRLHLEDEVTGELLPAAQLSFCGRTLLEGLIRDLQGREFLFYKLFGRQITIPVAAMTSYEKDNHMRVQRICEEAGWFGRGKGSFNFFIQKLVPLITEEGIWAMQGPLQPILKPGGHGVIWKEAKEQGVFEWFRKGGCRKAIVRQINNPIAGIDNGLYVLAGIGCHYKKSMGFASCDRLLSAAEGMNVLKEKKRVDGFEYGITNIEYTDFERCGIHDVPIEPGSKYSRFPANTNILFIDLEAIEKAVGRLSIPGMLINMKTRFKCYAGKNTFKEKYAGRLESTMQNIADCLEDTFTGRLKKGGGKELHTFLTYNKRIKTISVTKQSFEAGKSLVGTPEGCFYDLMENYHELLTKHCGMDIPAMNSIEDYLKRGPEYTVLFHPALGGVFSVVGQKIEGGRLRKGAEWIMEISEAEIRHLDLQGSLLIAAGAVMGRTDTSGILHYDSDACGKCTLLNVKVVNEGLGSEVDVHKVWKRQAERKEALRITLRGNAEFYAKDVTFEGDVHFDVPEGYRWEVSQQGRKWVCEKKKIEGPTWKWKFRFGEGDAVVLEKETIKT